MAISFLVVYLILVSSSSVCSAVASKKFINKARDDYIWKLNSYYRCMKKSETYVMQKLFRANAVMAVRDGDLKLDCFRCLSPEEQTEIEEIWKPNESFIGKKMEKIIDKVKEYILSKVEDEKKQKRVYSYAWEKADFTNISQDSWRKIVVFDSSFSVVEKTKSFMRKFMQRKGKRNFGDQFQLLISKISQEDMGWYRCAKYVNSVPHIINMYYVDVVFNSTPDIILSGSVKTQMQSMHRTFTNMKMQTTGISSPWSECSRCGKRKGEMRRNIACQLSILPDVSQDDVLNNGISYLQIFSSIPCGSSLVPFKIRSTLWSIKDIIHVRNCYVPCPKILQNNRFIVDLNEFGRNLIIDKVPFGEYRIDERIPPLRKAVKREAIQGIENDPYVLSCPENGFGIFWSVNETYISSKSLLKLYPNKRIYISSDNQLIINYLKAEDDDSFYSCHREYDGTVLRTFSFIVTKKKQRQQVLNYINFGIRCGAFLLMVLMVFTTVLDTNIRSEKYRRNSSLKLCEKNIATMQLLYTLYYCVEGLRCYQTLCFNAHIDSLRPYHLNRDSVGNK